MTMNNGRLVSDVLFFITTSRERKVAGCQTGVLWKEKKSGEINKLGFIETDVPCGAGHVRQSNNK